jgi:uncharacterized membrane protein YdjX (TVP38/TMEM64 family)
MNALWTACKRLALASIGSVMRGEVLGNLAGYGLATDRLRIGDGAAWMRREIELAKLRAAWRHYRRWLWLPALVWPALLAWRFGPNLASLAQDPAALRVFVQELGWQGPLALILINAAQILVAPIPGYVMQAAAGYLYGAWWGGVYGALGLLVGAMLAMALARVYGRPLVERVVGQERLAQWERVSFSTSTLVWFVILVTPTGDVPYFLAGLSHVSFRKIFLLTLLIRVPTTFVVAAAGAGTWFLTGWQLALLIGGLGLVLLFFVRFQDRFAGLVDRQVQRRLSEEEVS